jgi:ABC-2 type transport system permease protein
VSVILLMLGASVATGVMVDGAELSPYLRLINPLSTPLELPSRLFGSTTWEYRDVATPAVVAANLAWFLGGALAVGLRYRKLRAV